MVGEPLLACLRFASFGLLGFDAVPIWCDNEAALLVSKDASSVKRLAYIAKRVRLLQELSQRGIVSVESVPGKANPADALTKNLERSTFRTYMARLYNVDPARL